MDVQMPGMDGFEATALIRAAEQGTGRHVPIVALTAFARSEDRTRCLESGMDCYIKKPVDVAELRKVIKDCLSMGQPTGGISTAEETHGAWDLAAALARVDGDRLFLQKMSSLLLEQLPALMGEIRQAIEDAEPDRILAPAHTLKNFFHNFFAMAAVAMADELEEFAHRGNLAGAMATYATLERETARFVRAIESFATAPEIVIHSNQSS
jgi:CheY-like chemotaxis protein